MSSKLDIQECRALQHILEAYSRRAAEGALNEGTCDEIENALHAIDSVLDGKSSSVAMAAVLIAASTVASEGLDLMERNGQQKATYRSPSSGHSDTAQWKERSINEQ
jgi:hypothetical protein